MRGQERRKPLEQIGFGRPPRTSLLTASISGTVPRIDVDGYRLAVRSTWKCLPESISGPLFFSQVVGDHGGAGFNKQLFRFAERVGKIAFDVELGHKLLLH